MLEYANSDELRSVSNDSDSENEVIRRKRKKKYGEFNETLDLHENVHLEVGLKFDLP